MKILCRSEKASSQAETAQSFSFDVVASVVTGSLCVSKHCVISACISETSQYPYWTLNVVRVTKIYLFADDKCGFRLFDVHVSHALALSIVIYLWTACVSEENEDQNETVYFIKTANNGLRSRQSDASTAEQSWGSMRPNKGDGSKDIIESIY